MDYLVWISLAPWCTFTFTQKKDVIVKILLSPAKLQDFSEPYLAVRSSVPHFMKEAVIVMGYLKEMSQSRIAELMKVSDSIAETTKDAVDNWGEGCQNGLALFAYRGEVFKSLHAVPLSQEEFERATDSVRILSAIYGLLRPTDNIEPYRLEVKTPLSVAGEKSLYSFWKEKVTGELIKELDPGEVVINLASTEYAKMIAFNNVENPIITPQFKIVKEGKVKTAAVWAKKARGFFTRYLLEQNSCLLSTMKAFTEQGFYFSSYDEVKGEILFLKDM